MFETLFSSNIKEIIQDIFSYLPKWSNYLNNKKLIWLDFVDYCFRGVAQVVFMNNTLSGLFIFIGLCIQSPFVGVSALIGVISNTLTAIILGINKNLIRLGLFGYNGTLVGAALATFITPEWEYSTILAIILMSILSTMIHVSLTNLLSPYQLPVLTMPFNICALIFLFGTLNYRWFNVSFMGKFLNPLEKNMIEFNWIKILSTIPRGIGQVYLCDNWISGLFVWLGILICSRIAFIFAGIGSIVGIIMCYVLGGSYSDMIFGLWSYNSVLGSMVFLNDSFFLTMFKAIGGFFFYLNKLTIIMTIFCSILICLIFGMLKNFFTLWGLPSLTLSFCFGTFIFLLQKSSYPYFIAIPLDQITTPEGNLKSYKHQTSQIQKKNDENKELLNNQIKQLQIEIESLKLNLSILKKEKTIISFEEF